MTAECCDLLLRACLATIIAASIGCPEAPREDNTQKKAAASSDEAAIARFAKILETSSNREELERAAIALAGRREPRAVARLGDFLRRGEFLARLDDLNDSSAKTRHLSHVMSALAEHPIEEVATLCVALGNDPEFISDDDRKDLLLIAIAAVKPMTEASASFFRLSNSEGYFAFNAPLLARNGSPLALDLFATMMLDQDVPSERRVDCMHAAIVPTRTNLPVLEVCGRILARTTEEPIAIGVVESVFDYQGRKWFGPAKNAPQPVPWKDATEEVLFFVTKLGEKVRERGELPSELSAAVQHTMMAVKDLQQPRKK